MKTETRKTIFLLLASLCILFLASTYASALPLQNGPVWGHLSDWTAIATDRGAEAGDENGDGYIGEGEVWNPTGGVGIDEGIAIARIDSFYNANNGDNYWSSNPDQRLTVLQYGQTFEGIDGAGNAYFQGGGTVDIYLDESPITPFDASDQLGFTYSGGKAQFPNMNDDSLWLTGTYSPLFDDANANGARDAGEALIDFDGDGSFSTYTVNFSGTIGVGLGSATGWMDFTGGSFNDFIGQGFLGTWGSGEYDMSFSAELDPSGKYGQPQGWQTRSSDPVYFKVVPEPSTFLLLGAGLFGAATLFRRKRSE